MTNIIKNLLFKMSYKRLIELLLKAKDQIRDSMAKSETSLEDKEKLLILDQNIDKLLEIYQPIDNLEQKIQEASNLEGKTMETTVKDLREVVFEALNVMSKSVNN